MNLETRQARAQWEEKSFPELVKKLETTAGVKIPVEIVWDKFEKADIQTLTHGFFGRLNEDLAKICKDKLGKEAVAGSIKKVIVHCVATAAEKKMELKDGTFTVWGAWGKSEGYIGSGEYNKYLMKTL